MPAEATMLVVDNSEYMRNGDYQPTRYEAMADALYAVFTAKTDSNPESTVGLMSMAGKAPEVHVTHTRELGQIVQAAHVARTKLGGSVDIPTALNVAQLALKHRQNKNCHQRIVLFIGSPPDGPGCDAQSLQRLGKKLKKNSIAVDIVAFGDGIEDSESSSLKAFVEAISSNDNSHYVAALPDPRRLLSDVVLSSSILHDDRGVRDQAMADITNAAGAGGNLDEYGGIDPNIDPELAMAIRMSMEEERARQRAQEQATASAANSSQTQASTSTPSTSLETPPNSDSNDASIVVAPSISDPAVDQDEDTELQEALRMSRSDVDMHEEGHDTMDEDEEAEIAKAIEMSMQQDSEDQQQQEQ